VTAAYLRLVADADRELRAAGTAFGLWRGDGGSAWSVRRAAAGRVLDRLDEAARAVVAAREALVQEVEAETDRMLAADGTGCAVGWGVCPDHGNTLSASGGRTWCRRAGCRREWGARRVDSHCNEPAVAVVADQHGGTVRLCAGHWLNAQATLVGAELVRALPSADST
jgi:hypothetical protein